MHLENLRNDDFSLNKIARLNSGFIGCVLRCDPGCEVARLALRARADAIG